MLGDVMGWEEMGELLAGESLGRLGLVHEGRPYVIPMPFLFWQGAIYMSFRGGEGRKNQALRQTPYACFEVDWNAYDLGDCASVLLEGELEEVPSGPLQEQLLDLLHQKYLALPRPPGALKVLASGEGARLMRLQVEAASGLKAAPSNLDWIPLFIQNLSGK